MTETAMEAVLIYRSILDRYAEELWEIRRELAFCRVSLKEAWQAPETEGILNTVKELEDQARRLSDELSEIGFDMLKVSLELAGENQTEGNWQNG